MEEKDLMKDSIHPHNFYAPYRIIEVQGIVAATWNSANCSTSGKNRNLQVEKKKKKERECIIRLTSIIGCQRI